MPLEYYDDIPGLDSEEDEEPKGTGLIYYDDLPEMESTGYQPPLPPPPPVAPKKSLFKPEVDETAKALLGVGDIDSSWQQKKAAQDAAAEQQQARDGRTVELLREGGRSTLRSGTMGAGVFSKFVGMLPGGDEPAGEYPGIPEAEAVQSWGTPETTRGFIEGARTEAFQHPEDFEMPKNWWEGFIFNVPQIVGQAAATAIGGHATGTLAMLGQIAGAQFDDLTQQGVSEDRAMALSIVNGLIQAPLEQIGMGTISSVWKPKVTLLKRLKNVLKHMGTEGLTEFLQKYPEEITSLIAKNPGTPVADLGKEVLKNFWDWTKEGLQWDMPIGMAMGAFFGAPGALGRAGATDIDQIQKAKDERTTVKKVFDYIKDQYGVEGLFTPGIVAREEPEPRELPLTGEPKTGPREDVAPDVERQQLDREIEEKINRAFDEREIEAALENMDEIEAVVAQDQRARNFKIQAAEAVDEALKEYEELSKKKQVEEAAKKLEEVEMGVKAFILPELLASKNIDDLKLLPMGTREMTHVSESEVELAAKRVEAALEYGSPEAIAAATKQYEAAQKRVSAVVRNNLRKNPEAKVGEVYKDVKAKVPEAEMSRQEVAKVVREEQAKVAPPEKVKLTETQELVTKKPTEIRQELDRAQKEMGDEMTDKYNPAKIGSLLFQDLKSQGFESGEAKARAAKLIEVYEKQYEAVRNKRLAEIEEERKAKEAKKAEKKLVAKEKPKTKKLLAPRYQKHGFPPGTTVVTPDGEGKVTKRERDLDATAREVYITEGAEKGDVYTYGVDELKEVSPTEGVKKAPESTQVKKGIKTRKKGRSQEEQKKKPTAETVAEVKESDMTLEEIETELAKVRFDGPTPNEAEAERLGGLWAKKMLEEEEKASVEDITTGGRTARTRPVPAKPIRLKAVNKLFKGDLLHHGVGKDRAGTEFMQALEPVTSVTEFDPNHAPNWEAMNNEYDTVVSNFVLNVLPPDVRFDVIQEISDVTKDDGQAIVTVRAIGDRSIVGEPELDGVRTSIGTFQKGYTIDDIVREMSRSFGNVEVVAKATDRITVRATKPKRAKAAASLRLLTPKTRQEGKQRILEAAFPGAKVTPFPTSKDVFTVTMPNGVEVSVKWVGTIKASPAALEASINAAGKGAGTRVTGLWKHAKDARVTGRGLIYLATLNPMYAHHEAFHAAVTMVLSENELKALRAKYGSEEKAAYAYQSWSPSESNTIFEKILNFARRLLSVFRPSPELIFQEIRSGGVWERRIKEASYAALPLAAAGNSGVQFAIDRKKWPTPHESEEFGTVNNRLSKELEVVERLLGPLGSAKMMPGKLDAKGKRPPVRTIAAHDLGKEIQAAKRDGRLKALVDEKITPDTLADERNLKGKEREKFIKEVEDLRSGPLYLELDEKGKPILSQNGKAGMSVDLMLATCQPTMPCKECYAAKSMIRMSSVRKAVRNTVHLMLDPKGFAERVAKEAAKVKKTKLPFIRLLGSGDLTSSEAVKAFNHLAQIADRPIQIFSRHHENLAKLKGTKSAPFIKMGSIDADLVEYYGEDFLIDNMKERGIANVFLLTDKSEIPTLKKLNKAGALHLVFASNEDLHKELSKDLRQNSCPCDAQERTYMASCRVCALGNLGCHMNFSDKGIDENGKVWEITDDNAPDDLTPITVFVEGDEVVEAYGKAAADIIQKSIELVNLYKRAFLKGERDYIPLKDIRFPNDVIRVDSAEKAEQFVENLKAAKKLAEQGTFELPGGEIQPTVAAEKGKLKFAVEDDIAIGGTLETTTPAEGGGVGDLFAPHKTGVKTKAKRIMTKAQSWKTYLVDKYHPIKKYLGEAAYKMHRMLAGVDSLYTALMKHGTLRIDENGEVKVDTSIEGVEAWLESKGKMADDMFKWAVLKRAERLEKIENRRGKKKGQPKEKWITGERKAELQQYIDETGVSDEDYRKLYDEFVEKYHEPLLEIAHQMGIISKEHKKSWLDEVYIPFHRVFTSEEGDEFSAHPMSTETIASKLKKELKGAEMKLGDPIENIAANWAYILREALRNNALTHAILTAETIQNTDIGTDNIIEMAKESGPNTLSYLVDGKRRHVKVLNPELFQALNTANKNVVPSWFRTVFGIPKKLLTWGVTKNPAFIIANTTRDTMAAGIVSKDFIPVVDSIRGFIHIMRKSDTYIRAMAAGALFGGSYTRADDPKSLYKLSQKMRPRKGKGIIIDSMAKLIEMYGNLVDASENAARVGIFAKQTAKGASDYEAAYEARDITDFSNHGAAPMVQYILTTLPFLGARMQGNYKLYREMTENPIPFFLKGGALALASVALWSLYKDDDRYKELEDWDKWTYYHFWVGDQHFKIPKPFEVGVFFSSAIESTLNVATDREDADFLGRFAWHAFNETMAFNPVPQLAKPAIEVWSNKNMFTGRPIEGRRLQARKPGERADYWTSELLQIIGKKINKSPKKMEALVRGYFGPLGVGILSGGDQVARWFGDFPDKPTLTKGDYPVIGRFWKEGPARNSKYMSRLYDAIEESNQLVQTVKHYKETGDMEYARKLAEKEKPLYRMNKALNRIQRKLSKIRKKERKIYERRDLTPEQKREYLDRYELRINELAKRYYEKLREYTEKYE